MDGATSACFRHALELSPVARSNEVSQFAIEDDAMRARFPRVRAASLALLLTFAATAVPLTSGCSSRTTTTTQTRSLEQADADSAVKTETTTEKESHGPGIGILSGTVRAIGFILALPFKIVGGLIQLIF
jgi:hypothetical protein